MKIPIVLGLAELFGVPVPKEPEGWPTRPRSVLVYSILPHCTFFVQGDQVSSTKPLYEALRRMSTKTFVDFDNFPEDVKPAFPLGQKEKNTRKFARIKVNLAKQD